MWNLKNKLVNTTKKKQTHREDKLVVTSGEREGGRGKIGVGEEEVQTIAYKINKLQGSIVQHSTIFCSNYKWSIIYKNFESLCCTPKTNIVINYASIKNYANRDFPGGTVVKNPPVSAWDAGSIPGPGRSHMPQSNLARAPQLLKPVCLEPVRLEPVLRNKRSHHSEKPAHHSEE